jgi:hypothetical protein
MAHRDQIAEINQKILELEREHQRINEQLAAYRQIRDGFAKLSRTDNAAPLVPTKIGPTEAIKVILGKHPDGLTPTQIREELAEYGITCGSDKNFLGNIHSIIKRSKDIEEVGVGGRKIYRLKAEFPQRLGFKVLPGQVK